MASSNAYDAVKAHLVSALGGSYPVHDWEEAVPLMKGTADAFLALEEEFSTETLIAFGDPGNNLHRESGAILVHCFAPADGGATAARAIGDLVQLNLRSQQLTGATSPVEITSVDPPTTGAFNDGVWSSVTVSADYQSDQHT